MPNEAYAGKSANQIITDLADAHDIPISAVRMMELARLADRAVDGKSGDAHKFAQHGLKVELSYAGSTATLDFTPDGHMRAPEEPEKRALFAWYFIRAMESYVLLVESGVLKTPHSFVATTNERMATFVTTNFGGATSPRYEQTRVEVGYEQMRDSLFGEEVREMERSLATRLGQHATGAVNASMLP